MRCFRSYIVIVILLCSAGMSFIYFDTDIVEAATDVYLGGSVTGDWSNVYNYHITSDTYIPAGGTLNITQGTRVIFDSPYKFDVLGTLNAVGSPGNYIYFTSHMGSPTVGSWPGININGGSAVLKYVIIEYANVALTITSSSPVLEYCILRHNEEAVVAGTSANPDLLECTMHDNTLKVVTLESNSRMDMVRCRINNTGATPLITAITQKSTSQLYAVNSTIEANYTRTIETSGSASAVMLNCSLNMSYSRYNIVGTLASVTIKNYLHVYAGTKTQVMEQPLVNATVKVTEDQNLKHFRYTDINGTARWMDVTYAVMDGTGVYYPAVNVSIDHGGIFKPYRHVNMSSSHWEHFVNDIPVIDLDDLYYINEDSADLRLIDIWDFVEDDYDADDQLTFDLVYHTGRNATRTVRLVQNRYIHVNLTAPPGYDNETGQLIEFQINVSDRLGKTLGLVNNSDVVHIGILEVNDPPMWFNISTFHVKEDDEFLGAMYLPDHVKDDRTSAEELVFSVNDFDPVNYNIYVDQDDYLNIKVKTANLSSPTNVTLSAMDAGNLTGNYTTKILIDPVQDPPAVVKGLPALFMDEDTAAVHPVGLNEVFFDSDGDNLSYSFSGNGYVGVKIDPEKGNITFTPAPDWFGKRTMTFYANDSIHNISTTIDLTVKGINDPPSTPVIIYPADTDMRVYKQKELITFSAYAYDPDIDLPGLDPESIDDVLTFTWTRDTSGSILSNQANFTKDLTEGHHNITLKVTDSGGLWSSVTFDIVVLGELKLPEVWHKRPFPESISKVKNVRLEWNVSADNTSLEFLRYDVLLGTTDPPATIVAEKITTTFFIITELVERTDYYWTVVPYIADQEGIDRSGVWKFLYDPDGCDIYDVELKVDREEVKIMPNNHATINITVTNKGCMPDIYKISVDVISILDDIPDWRTLEIEGLGNGIYSMQSNEEEKVVLTLTVPDGFEMTGTYEITITVESLSKDESDEKTVDMDIVEPPEIKISSEPDQDNRFLLYLTIIIAVIIVAVIVILFAYNTRTAADDEEVEEDEDEDEEQETISEETGDELDEGDSPEFEDSIDPVEDPAVITPADPGQISGFEQGPEPLEETGIDGSGTEESEEEPAEAGSPTDLGRVICGSCGGGIPLTSTERPLEVNCSECGFTFTLKD